MIFKSQADFNKYDVSTYITGSEDFDLEDYEYDSNIVNVLLIGIDSKGAMSTSATFGDQARADNIELISFNTHDKTVKILPISRDTMTDIMQYSASGYEMGRIKTHLGFAFTYGNGGNESSMNVCDAVSNLLYGTNVYRYVTTNIDSIGYANDLIGGVTVEVPNNDLARKYSFMTKGNKVKLDDSNVADFLRFRLNTDGSNNGRMERQVAFLQAYVQKLETMSHDDYVSMWNKLSSDTSKIKTNMDKKMFMSLIGNLKEYTYDPDRDNLKIIGENDVEDGYDVFYPDQDALKQLVIDNYFRRK
ncbi:MAG: LCP family protein [Clostridia bacterium]|nr:LCP family protein [Clostridia bacterium]